jgi:hypothetical protein
VHFTFLDGAIGYDCVRCGSRCCKGLGFSLRHEELIPFLGKSPKLAPFIQIHRNYSNAFDLADGCWLLGDDGRCGLEVEHGRAAKPSACRLFPLQARRVLGQLVADVQLLACPLEDAAALGGRGMRLTHEEAAVDIAELGAAFAPELLVARGAPDDLLEGEARLREGTRDLLDVGDSAALLARLHGADEADLSALRADWRRWFGVEDGFDASRPMALALPALRLSAISAPNSPPWPRLQRALPLHLLAASFYMELSARAGRAVTLRGIAEVWRSTASARALLARWREVHEVPAEPPPIADLQPVWNQIRASDRPIGEALEAAAVPLPLRPVLFRALADRLL